MFKKLKTVQEARIKKSNINTFLFFLLFAVVIWVFVQFSKQYNEIVQIPIEYVNVPPDKLLTEDNPKFLKLKMEENGFRIALFSMFPPTLQIDVSKTVQDNGKLLYVIDENRNDILSQLDIDFDDHQFIKGALAIDYEQKEEKTLPVIPRIEVSFAAGFAAAEKVQIEPDSIRVSGAENSLDTLTRLVTHSLKLKEVKEDVSGMLPIDTTSLGKITLYQQQVRYRLDVEKFTEGRVVVPIELVNVPQNQNVVIFPKETVLLYQVHLKNYNKVSAGDFRVIADFSKVKEDQDFLIPEIAEQPDFISNLRLNEKRIQFVIKK